MTRPVSTVVFGILNIGYGLLSLLAMALAGLLILNRPDGRFGEGNDYAQLILWWGAGSSVAGGIFALVLIAGGIGLLLMRPWGRILSLTYACYAVVMSVLGTAVQVLVMQQTLAAQPPDNRKLVAVIAIASTVIGFCISLGYPLLMGFFLTRPAFVAAFRRKAVWEDPQASLVAPYVPVASAIVTENPYAPSQLPALSAPPAIPEQPRAPAAISHTVNAPARTSALCGMLSLIPLVGLPFSAAALYYGVRGLQQEAAQPTLRGSRNAWTGIVCGTLFGIFSLLAGLLVTLLIVSQVLQD